MEDVEGARTGGGLSGGELLTAISNRIVGLIREHYGRGPMKSKTYIIDDLVVCVLRDGGTPHERTMISGGLTDSVIAMRREFQELMAEKYKRSIEELTGSRVLAFMSGAHLDPDVTLEIFIVDPPVDTTGSAGDDVIPGAGA